MTTSSFYAIARDDRDRAVVAVHREILAEAGSHQELLRCHADQRWLEGRGPAPALEGDFEDFLAVGLGSRAETMLADETSARDGRLLIDADFGGYPSVFATLVALALRPALQRWRQDDAQALDRRAHSWDLSWVQGQRPDVGRPTDAPGTERFYLNRQSDDDIDGFGSFHDG